MNNTYFPSLPKVPTQLQAVEVSISVDYLEDILAFLLTKKISFGMTYKSAIVPAKPLEPDLTKERHESSNDSYSNAVHSPMRSVMEAICQKYIHDNIEQIPPKEIEISEEYHLKLSTFKRTFKSCYGKSFYQMYMDKKMEYAKKLLLQGIRAAKVSERVGYAQPIKFNKTFQKYFGMTPKQYQTTHLMK